MTTVNNFHYTKAQSDTWRTMFQTTGLYRTTVFFGGNYDQPVLTVLPWMAFAAMILA